MSKQKVTLRLTTKHSNSTKKLSTTYSSSRLKTSKTSVNFFTHIIAPLFRNTLSNDRNAVYFCPKEMKIVN